jgi:hypothetical protein
MKSLLVAMLVVVGGCSSDLPAANFIDKLRVLAVQAQPPEVAPGDTTALHVLAVEPLIPSLDGSAPRPLTAVWLACALPAGTLTVQPCTSDSVIIGTDLDASYSAAADALGGGAASTEVLITVAVADNDAGALACIGDIANNNGVPTDPDHCVVSIKRLTISDPMQRTVPANQNPALADFYATTPSGFAETLDDGNGVWQFAPSEDKAQWDIAAHRAPDAAERKADGTYEALSVSWFTTAGHLDGGRSLYLPPDCNSATECPDQLPEDGADTLWFAPTRDQASDVVDASGLVDFWAVIRDDRGGVGWRSGSLSVTP